MRWALAVTGPTASGKTALSIELAKALGAEIVCMDSMQIYRDMDIGTAKPTSEERSAVPHHMTDFLPFSENYNAENYKTDALRVIDDITARGCVPMLVGGTGLYLDTLTARGKNEAPESDREYINRQMAGIKTPADAHAAWEKLLWVDPDSAAAIHENNIKRVLRAFEIYEKSGKTKTYFDEMSKRSEPDVKVGMITLDFHSRELLYKRTDTRVEKMMEEGLYDEVVRLKDEGLFECDFTAAQAIGYKEIGEHLSGKCTLPRAVENLKQATRRYAKRQLTWFKHEKDAYRLFTDTEDGKMRDMSDILKEALGVFKAYLEDFKNKYI